MPDDIVRKHPAPEGALRLSSYRQPEKKRAVRKHPAPEGALRPSKKILCALTYCQKAPSTRRCIKTFRVIRREYRHEVVRKHPAPEGALKPLVCADGVVRHAAKRQFTAKKHQDAK